MTFVEHFRQTYYDKLITPSGNNPVRNRADSLLKVFDLLKLFKPIDERFGYRIIETGTTRRTHGELNFSGDGCMTVIFDDFIKNFSVGKVHSVDIDGENCEYANSITSDATNLHNQDSVEFLYKISEEVKIDVLVLDSFDVEAGNHHPSSLHHIFELCAAMKNLTSKSIVIVDDFNAFFDGGKTGKGVYVKQFIEKINAEIIHQDYQLVFRLR